MKSLIAIALASFCLLGLIGCEEQKVLHERRFAAEQDARLHCPKCGGTPGALVYHPANNYCEDGGATKEHFLVNCAGCGFTGWASLSDGNCARRAIQ